MPPRLSKRQQRGLEELEALQAGAVAAESAPGEGSEERPTAPAFAALMQDGDVESEEEPSEMSQAKSHKKKKKKKKAPARELEPADTPGSSTPKVSDPDGPSNLSKKEWKLMKKQKAKAAKDEGDDLDKALAELSLKHPELTQSVQNDPATMTSNAFFALLVVSLQHLDSEAEMRKFFGAKVISASKSSSASGNKRTTITVRSNLTRPQQAWGPASLRQGLSCRLLAPEEISDNQDRHQQKQVSGEKTYTVEYSKKYRGLTKAFIQMVMTGDPNGLFNLLRSFPYHADTLLQISEVYFHREEHSTASDFIDRALFTYERAFLGSLSFTSGTHRLDFDRVENRPFFLAVHRQVCDLQRRGCVRTAFEFARLLYSLDPSTDPHGALFHLDYLAIKSGMSRWLLDMWDVQCNFGDEEWKHRVHVKALPGWAYTRALALYIDESQDHTRSTDALTEAIRAFPSIVPVLADKADIALPRDIRSDPLFRIHSDASTLGQQCDAILHLLSHLYAQRSFSLWKPDKRAQWFTNTVASIAPSLKTTPMTKASKSSPSSTLFQALYSEPSIAYSVYRHIIVLENASRTGHLFGFLPTQVTATRKLSCDPLPPPSRVSEYDANFFQGAEDPFALRMGTRRDNQRLLEHMIPDPVIRRQLQDLFAANPQFAQRFPGGIIEFAQMAGQMPEDALEDLMLAVVGGAQHQDQAHMPGGLDLDGIEDLPEHHIHDRAHAPGQVPDVDLDEEAEAPSEEEEDETVDVAPLPVRFLRNIMNRFWGVEHTAQSSDDEDEGPDPRDNDGVD